MAAFKVDFEQWVIITGSAILLLLCRILVIFNIMQVCLRRLGLELLAFALVQEDGVRDWALSLLFQRGKVLLLLSVYFWHRAEALEVWLRRMAWRFILNL